MPMITQPLRKLPTLAISYLQKLPKVCGPFSLLWKFAQWMCHWYNAAVTGQYANEL
jgi:hypothetical protein